MPEQRRRVLVVGAGLAGLAAARAALEAGADVDIVEATDAPGGASIDAAGWIWRARDLATFRAQAPDADVSVQQLILEQLDTDIDWLVGLGTTVLASTTGRDLTRGVRVHPPQLIAQLVDAVDARRIQVRTPFRTLDEHAVDAVVLAGGGYAGQPARIAREAGLPDTAKRAWTRRPRVANDGSAMDAALRAGARRSIRDGQCLVRIAAVGVTPDPDLAAAISELHVPASRLVRADGVVLVRDPDDWSGARQLHAFQRSGMTGYLEFGTALLDARVHSGTVGEIIARAARAGARVDETAQVVRIAVQPGITHTWCGLDVDTDARVQFDGAAPSVDVFAAGCDAAGTGLGGTASGLAQALVLGRRAGTIAAAG